MSLQLAAQHMASRGRGPDTQLVHMAPQEVAGLQALAKAHGGSLTTNPDTGLPEAGFLSSILPMVIGGALAATGVGAPMAAMMVGGGYGLATGSLSKGLMAGMGAFGGAGLASGLIGAGAAGAAEAGMAGAGANALGTVAPEAVAANLGVQGAATGAGSQAAMLAEQTAGFGAQGLSSLQNAAAIPGTSMVAPQGVVQSVVNQVPVTTSMPQLSQQGVLNEAAARTAASPWDSFKAGFGEVGKDPSRFMTMENAKYAMAAGLPMLMQEPEKAAQKPSEKPWMYSYDPGRVADPQAGYSGAYTGERNYFNPVYTRTAAGGGLMDIGPVEAMSDRNQAETMMANGGMRYAEGGETKAVKTVEENPYYTMSGQSGDAFKYLMGQGPKPTPVAAPVVAAPVQSTVQPAAEQPKGVVSSLLGALGSSGSGATMRPFTFDPATGTFTAMPVVEPEPTPAPTLGTLAYEGGYGMAQGGIAALAQGGQSHLGDYSDGGRLLKGPGDGVSDSIPATIGEKRPARLADGEFVVPARIVSELGNGSTEAGARKLYAMMDRVQKARSKTVGKDRVAVNSRAEKLLPV